MSEKKEVLRKRLAEAGVELIRANEALADAKQNIGRLERQFQGLLAENQLLKAESQRTKDIFEDVLYSHVFKGTTALLCSTKVLIRCQDRVFTACKAVLAERSQKLKAFIGRQSSTGALADITINKFSPGAVEIFLCALHTKLKFFRSDPTFPLCESLEALKMLHCYACRPAVIDIFLMGLRKRLDAYWKRGGGGPTFTALLEKLILLQDNDFGPDIEAFATLQYDLILRLPEIKEVWAAITDLKEIEVFTREFTLQGATLEECHKVEGFVPNLGLMAIATVRWPQMEVTMPSGPRHSVYNWSLRCKSSNVEGYVTKRDDMELIMDHPKVIDLDQEGCSPDSIFKFTVSFTNTGYRLYVLSEWFKKQKEMGAIFFEAIDDPVFDIVDLWIYFEGHAFKEVHGLNAETIAAARDIKKLCAEACRLLSFNEIGGRVAAFSKETLQHMFRAHLSRPICDAKETSRMLLSNLFQWYALCENPEPTELISIIEEFRLFDQMTMLELFMNFREAQDILTFVPERLFAEALSRRLADSAAIDDSMVICQDEKEKKDDDDHKAKRPKGA